MKSSKDTTTWINTSDTTLTDCSDRGTMPDEEFELHFTNKVDIENHDEYFYKDIAKDKKEIKLKSRHKIKVNIHKPKHKQIYRKQNR
jgi:hypothetical protein